MINYNQMRRIEQENNVTRHYTFGPFNKGDIFRRMLITFVSTDTNESAESLVQMNVRVKDFETASFSDGRSIVQGSDEVPGPADFLVPCSVGLFVLPVNWIPNDQPQWITLQIVTSETYMTGGLKGAIFTEAGPLDFFV